MGKLVEMCIEMDADVDIWTWGTGSAFVRELGTKPNRNKRCHTATSIVIPNAHFLIDAGAGCVDSMIEKNITIPDVLFLTHSHFDHISDLDRLANSRMRGLMISSGVRDFRAAKAQFGPLQVIGSKGALFDQKDGVASKFGYLEGYASWTVFPSYDVWYSIRKADRRILPSMTASREEEFFPLEFKALPVYHSVHSPGSSLFVFRKRGGSKRIVITGDFESIEDSVTLNPSLLDPACLVLDTTTIKAVGTHHTNWVQNKKLISRWASGEEDVFVLLNHISGFLDWAQGYYDHVPDEADWKEAIASFRPPSRVRVELAEDGRRYSV